MKQIVYLLLLISTQVHSESCGIPSKYLEGISHLSYLLSEITQEIDKKPTEAGSIMITWNLACDDEGEWDFEGCKSRNCDSKCGAIRVSKSTGISALKEAQKLRHMRKGELLMLGWAVSDELKTSGLPLLKGKVYLAGYKILNYDMSSSGTKTSCSNFLVE